MVSFSWISATGLGVTADPTRRKFLGYCNLKNRFCDIETNRRVGLHLPFKKTLIVFQRARS
jgi:hypothetical protein